MTEDDALCGGLLVADLAFRNLAKVLTEDEALRIASNIAKLPGLLGAAGNSD